MQLLGCFLLTITVLSLYGQVSSIDPENTDVLAVDVYNEWTDREIILSLVKRIGDLEKQNGDLVQWNRNQQEEIDKLHAVIRQQEIKIDQIESNLVQKHEDSIEEKAADILRQESVQQPEEEQTAEADENSGQSKVYMATRASSPGIIQSSGTWLQDISRIRRQTESTYRVAFYATTTDHLLNLGAGQVIEFQNVTTNIGNGYNSNTGIFTAPQPGTYVFSVSLMGVSASHQTHYIFAKNNGEVSRLFIRGTDSPYTTSSHTIVLQLKQGDDIEIRNLDVGEGIHGHRYSCFSGFLLYYGGDSDMLIG